MNVVLKNLQPLPHYPHAVCGQSGITYGHAMFDPAYNAHVFRLPYEEWVGDKGKDIASRAAGPFNRYHVLVEIFDGVPFAPATQREAELKDAHIQLDEVRRENERLRQLTSPMQSIEPADRRITDSDKLESAAQDSRLARDVANAERGVTVQGPAEGMPETPTSIDEAQTGFLIAAKQGLPLEEKRVETNPDTGASELVEREATPAASGVPQQPPGETSVTPYVSVHETRTSLAPAEGESKLIAAAKDIDTTKPVLDPDNAHSSVRRSANVPVNATPTTDAAQKEGAPAADADTTTDTDPDNVSVVAEGDLSGLKFRQLRKIAKDEGVPEFESLNKSEDLIAAIQLNREGKDNGDTATK